MRLHPAPFVLLVVLSAAACSRQRAPEEAPGPAAALSTPDRAQQELDKLQGTWRIESSVFNGIREPDVVKSITIVFQGDKFIVIDRDGNRQEETIKLMPDQNPRAIDCSSKDGTPSPGIYSLDGDTFKWCSAGGSKKVRPTTFTSKPGSRYSLMVLRRQKS